MRNRFLRVLAYLLATVLLTSCATSGRPPGTSGFLGDYSALVKGRADQARLIYFHPAADFSGYDAIIIDPIEVWDPKESAAASSPSAELSADALYFENTLRKHLEGAYRVVAVPQGNTLRLSIALSTGRGSAGNIEAQLTDAFSLVRLAAAVDVVQSVAPGAAFGTDDLKPLYDRWAELLRSRLTALRAFDAAQKKASAAIRN
jgi:hypothetical protein